MVAPDQRDVVLLVDDEESFRLSVVDGLARYHERFALVTAADGVEALEAIEEHAPSLVVSDIRMPRLDGVELLVTCRKKYPSVHFVLLSAYFSEALERSARTFGATRILHKPLDLQVLVQAIIEVLQDQENMPPAGGYLPAFSLPGFLQLLGMEQKSCVLRLEEAGVGEGRLWIENGRPVDAEVGHQTGTPAALTMLGWPSPDITLQGLSRDFERRITEGVNYLLMESARLRDETDPNDSALDATLSFSDGSAAVEAPHQLTTVSETTNRIERQENLMTSMEETLQSLKDVTGFRAVGVFSPDGEIMAQVANSGTEIDSIGALANDVLLKAQKATDVMNVGRGNLCVINAPKATILVRCLNENTDFAANEPGRAHLHCAMVLEPNGNLGLAKMQLDKVMQQLAPLAR